MGLGGILWPGGLATFMDCKQGELGIGSFFPYLLLRKAKRVEMVLHLVCWNSVSRSQFFHGLEFVPLLIGILPEIMAPV